MGVFTQTLPLLHLLYRHVEMAKTEPLLPSMVSISSVSITLTLQHAVCPVPTTPQVDRPILVVTPLSLPTVVELLPTNLEIGTSESTVSSYVINLELLRLFTIQVRIPWGPTPKQLSSTKCRCVALSAALEFTISLRGKLDKLCIILATILMGPSVIRKILPNLSPIMG